MKLSACLMLALMVAVSADQPANRTGTDIHTNYNNVQPRRGRGWLDRLFGSNRRQGLAGILGGLGGAAGPIGLVVAVVVGVVVVSALTYAVSEINSSGKGIYSDEWEIDYSVWNDMLQKDFEDSWSEQ